LNTGTYNGKYFSETSVNYCAAIFKPLEQAGFAVDTARHERIE
jgi:hypothetical protein